VLGAQRRPQAEQLFNLVDKWGLRTWATVSKLSSAQMNVNGASPLLTKSRLSDQAVANCTAS
jgi:hypothetical protein